MVAELNVIRVWSYKIGKEGYKVEEEKENEGVSGKGTFLIKGI